MSFGFTSRSTASAKQIDVAFAEADTAGEGTLDAVGVHEALLAASGAKGSDVAQAGGHERIATLLPRYDGNNDGRLTLKEVKNLHAYLQKGHNVREEVFELYRTLALVRTELGDALAGRPPRAVYEPSPPIRTWLESLKAGLGRYSSAFTAIGIDNLDDIIESNDTEAAEIEAELKTHNPKPFHERRIIEAMQNARRASGKNGGGEDLLKVTSSRLKAVRIEEPNGAPKSAKAPPGKLVAASTWSSGLAKKLGSGKLATGGKLGSGKLGRNGNANGHAAPARCEGPSVREWLDEVKSGFAAKFAGKFEEFGIEFREDLSGVDTQLVLRLFEQLRTSCGAKELHRSLLQRALTNAGAMVDAGAAPASAKSVSGDKPAGGGDDKDGRHRWLTSGKRFAAFISHHKKDAAMEARYLKDKLEESLHAEIFLDSDQLQDLRLLLDHVKESEVVLLVQSAEVLLRPWCILEIHAAVSANIPIIAVSLRGKSYDFAEARHVLTHLDTELERRNPGASTILLQNGVQVIDAAFLLANVLPNIISVEFDASASAAHIQASIDDMLTEIDGLRKRPVTEIHITRAEWLAQRGDNRNRGAPLELTSNVSGGIKCARLPPELPALPKGYVVREALLAGVKAKILDNDEATHEHDHEHEHEHRHSEHEQHEHSHSHRGSSCLGGARALTAQGMGGSGKTVIVTALCNDLQVRSYFEKICFVSLGQEPEMRAIQASLYRQLTGTPLELAGMDETAILEALKEASTGKRVLLVIDDAWVSTQVHSFACLDAATESAAVVTTRIHGLVPGAPTVPLGVLEPDHAVALLLETAGALAVPPYDPRLYKAAEATGRLPLTLAVAGSMLEQFGGKCTDEYLRLLTEDRGEALREGEYGDMHVKVEDRIITATLDNYKGGEAEQVKNLFIAMAIFPEDVPIPASLFDLLAEKHFGASGKRPGLQVRSWLTALIRLSLVIGSLADGVYMHDIVRDYSMSRCKDLRGQHRAFLTALLDAAPEGGWPPPWQAGAFERSSPERYVSTQLQWHIRSAVVKDEPRDELMERFVAHSTGFGFTCVSALGREHVDKLCRAAEERGDYTAAAQYVNGIAGLYKEGDGTIEGAIDLDQEGRQLYRGIQLYTKADDGSATTINKMEYIMTTRAMQAAVTLEGVFTDPQVVSFCKARYDVLTRLRQQTEGDSYEYQRDVLKVSISDVCRDFFSFFAADDFDAETGMEDLTDRVIRLFGGALQGRLKLLKDYAAEPMQKCYAMAVLLFITDIGPTLRWCEAKFFEAAGIKSHVALIEMLGGAKGVLETLECYVDVQMEKEIEGDLWDWWSLCSGGPIFEFTGEIELLGRLVELRVAAYERLEQRRNEGLQVNTRMIESHYTWWLLGNLLTKLGMMNLAERLATIHGRDTWEGTLSFFNDVWKSQMCAMFGEKLNNKGGEGYQRAISLLDMYLVHGDEPEGAVLSLIGDVGRVIEQDRTVVLGFDWPNTGYSLAEAAALAAEKIGDDELAEQYASYVVERYSKWNEMTRITGRLVLARVQQRRGRRAAAIAHFENAANDALGGVHILLALRAGLECGGSEGAQMVERAIAATGRPREHLLTEYAAACGSEAMQEWRLEIGSMEDLQDYPVLNDRGAGRGARYSVG